MGEPKKDTSAQKTPSLSAQSSVFNKPLCIILAALFFLSQTNPLLGLEGFWKPTEFIWSLNFALTSSTPPKQIGDIMYHPSLYKKFKPGDIIWVQSCYLPQFTFEVLPKIKVPIVLVANVSDDTFPNDFREKFDISILLDNPNITHLFVQNSAFGNGHPKVTTIPIGLDFHTLAIRPHILNDIFATPSTQENLLKHFLQSLLPTPERECRIFVDFQHQDSIRNGCLQRYLELGEDRTAIFQQIVSSGIVDFYEERVPRNKLWEKKGQYAFSISPHGNGFDTHRTWEDLIIGCIVIVKTSPLDCLYEGLPVVIVQDWHEVTKTNLEKWHKQFGDAFTNPIYREKLTHRYWYQKILYTALRYKDL